MAFDTYEIVARICRYVAQNRIPLGAVRLQKLVYLMECDFYRWERSRLTELDWRFLHYGPWSAALADVAQTRFHLNSELLSDGRQFHGITYAESDFNRLPERFPDPTLQGIFLTVMEAWAAIPFEELLDHVYFHTPPMHDAQRGDELDFGGIIPASEEITPVNPYETLSPGRVAKFKEIAARWALRAPRRPPVLIPSDPGLADAMTQMNAEDRMEALNLDVEIEDASIKGIREAKDGG